MEATQKHQRVPAAQIIKEAEDLTEIAHRIKADLNEGKKVGSLEGYQAELERTRKDLLQ